MKATKYLNDYRNTIENNKTLKIAIIVLAIIIFIEGVFIIKAMNSSKVIVIPKVNSKYVISSGSANPAYVKSIGVYLISLVENFTPRTIEKNYKTFLDFTTSRRFGSLQAELISNETKFKKNGASSWFVIKSVHISNSAVIVNGVKRIIIGSSIVSTKNIQVKLLYKIINGEFEVNGYVEKNINIIA